MDSKDLVTITLRTYSESNWQWRWMGTGRRALDMGKLSIIFELWFIRK